MNLCKVIQVKDNSMKYTWSSDCGGGSKKIPYNGEYLNILVASAVAKAIKMNKKSKAKCTYES